MEKKSYQNPQTEQICIEFQCPIAAGTSGGAGEP